jgi:hypothetical protein
MSTRTGPYLAEIETNCAFKSWADFKVHLNAHHHALYRGHSKKTGKFFSELFHSEKYQLAEVKRLKKLNKEDARERQLKEQAKLIDEVISKMESWTLESKKILVKRVKHMIENDASEDD